MKTVIAIYLGIGALYALRALFIVSANHKWYIKIMGGLIVALIWPILLGKDYLND
jgi:hypothetical protein